ncbi:MAG: type II secretion system minor pseudopilin GspJ [Pseudomonadota bacterium]
MAPIKQTTRHQGFTLLELLIAITVFSILSTITYSGLKAVLDTEERTRDHIHRLSQLQIGLNLMQRDIEQAVTREIRDEFGDSLPAIRSGGISSTLLELTRNGYPNPMNLQRSGLQRVAYQLEEDALYRITWPSLDRAQDSSPRRSRLFADIQNVELIYYDQQMKRQQTWPAVSTEGDNPQYPLPKAIELTLEFEGMGKIRRLFRVAEAPATSQDGDAKTQ